MCITLSYAGLSHQLLTSFYGLLKVYLIQKTSEYWTRIYDLTILLGSIFRPYCTTRSDKSGGTFPKLQLSFQPLGLYCASRTCQDDSKARVILLQQPGLEALRPVPSPAVLLYLPAPPVTQQLSKPKASATGTTSEETS